MSVRIGDRVRDRITRVTGIVIARTEWLYGCVRVTIQPEGLKDGKPIEPFSLDEPGVDVLEAGVIEDVRPGAARLTEAAGPRPEVTRHPGEERNRA